MDLRCYDDMDELAAETVSDLEELQQDNYHRLITPPGGNPDDPDGGLGIAQMLSGPNDGRWGARIEGELLKDPRNAAVETLITPLPDVREGEGYSIDITIETDFGPSALGLVSDINGVRRVA